MLTGCHPAPPLEKFEYTRPEMGTVFRVVLYAADRNTAEHAANAAFARAEDLNAHLSDYDPNSELSQLSHRTNDGPMTEPQPVGPDLWSVLEQAQLAYRRSDGAFDVTVGPFVRLWRRSHQLLELPTPERIQQARQSVGFGDGVRLFPASHGVQLLKPRMRLDVGGIAKGYTAVQCMAAIRSFGITRAMFGAAGDLTVGDPPPGKAYWRVAVQDLAHPNRSAAYVKLRNQSISTSGDTERYVIINGQRYSHVVDPRTGLGLTRRIGVSVIAPDGTTADWMTKPPSVLGPERGLALIDATPGAAARIVRIDDAGQTHIYESKRWRDFVIDAAGPPD